MTANDMHTSWLTPQASEDNETGQTLLSPQERGKNNKQTYSLLSEIHTQSALQVAAGAQ